MPLRNPSYRGKRVLVLGFGLSGAAMVSFFLDSGAEVWAWDDAPAVREQIQSRARECSGLHVLELEKTEKTGRLVPRFDLLALSPGVPPGHELVRRAKRDGLDIKGELTLLREAAPAAKFLGVTGTNGKSTTTKLLSHLLEANDIPHQMGGNIGAPILALEPSGLYVLELSSFQLYWSPEVGVDIGIFLNITPDHLDWHGSFDAYLAAKMRLFAAPALHKYYILNLDDRVLRVVAEELTKFERNVVPVGTVASLPAGVRLAEDRFVAYLDAEEAGLEISLRDSAVLRGPHHLVNAACAWLAARFCGAEKTLLQKGLLSFQGLPFRLERLYHLEHRPGVEAGPEAGAGPGTGVSVGASSAMASAVYINDSKATNPESSLAALSSFENIVWIAGGKMKQGANYRALVYHAPRLLACWFYGADAHHFERLFAKHAAVHVTHGLEEAVGAALAFVANVHPVCDGKPGKLAVPEDVSVPGTLDEPRCDSVGRELTVLFSPACASFDQYANYQARGRHFNQCCQAFLAGNLAGDFAKNLAKEKNPCV